MQENSDSYLFTTPSSSLMSESLLFFDTFSHSSSEDEIFDLVQFPTPVIIDLIKIVPLGQPIEANIPGNVRLGATNPSNCEIKFFINDLSQQDADKMADLGKFHCSEKETDFNPPIQIQTDGLLLRGSYRTLTLAIFGQIAVYDTKNEETQAVPSAASPPAQTPASPVASERDLPFVVSRQMIDDEDMTRARDGSESIGNSTIRSGDIVKEDEDLDEEDAIVEYSSSKDDIRETIANEDLTMSEAGPVNNYREKKSIERDYSNSFDEDCFERNSSKNGDLIRFDRETSETINNNNESIGNNKLSDNQDDDIDEWTFKTESYNPSPLLYFTDPSLTLQERTIKSHDPENESHAKYSSSLEKDIKRVIDMFEFVDPNSDEWVTLIEEVANDIANLSLYKPLIDPEMIEFLVKQTCHGLDLNMALKQKQTGFKVRHLKAGLRLANNLIQCGPMALRALLEVSIFHRLLDLYDKEQMSLPIRLIIFRCLNVGCDNVEALDYIIHKRARLEGKVYQLDNLKQNEQQPTLEISEPKSEIPIKANISIKLESTVLSTSTSSPTPTTDSSQTELTCYEALVMILMSKPTTRALIAAGNLIKKIRLFKNLSDLAQMSKKNSDEIIESGDIEDTSNDKMMLHLKPCDIETCCNLIQDIVNLTKDVNSSIGQPIRYLPAETQFHVQHKPNDAHLSFYKWVKHFDTLVLIHNLLSTSRADIHDNASNIDLERSIRLRNLCLTFINNIVDSPCGLNFLLSEDLCKITSDILNALRTKDYTSKRPNHLRLPDDIDTCVNSSIHREEAQLECRSCDMYLRLVYSFKIYSCLDKLFHYHNEIIIRTKSSKQSRSKTASKSSNNNVLLIEEPERILHQLFILTNHAYGLESFIKHLSIIGNLDCLLRFLDLNEVKNNAHNCLEFVKETAIDYTLDLVGTFFRLNNQNIITISDEYLETLVELSKTKLDKNLSIRMKSFIPWLSPFEQPTISSYVTYSDDTFKELTRIIRKSITNQSIPFANDLDFELPPKLITAVRILRQLCIPPEVELYVDSIFDPFSNQAQMDRLINQTRTTTSFMDQHVLLGTDNNVGNNLHGARTNQSWNMSFHQSSRNNLISNNLNNINLTTCVDDNLFSVEQLNQMSSLFKLFEPYDEDICGELKYHYAIMKLYEQEGLKRLLNTLRELIGNYPNPSFQAAALSGIRGRIVLSYIHSVILLVQSIIFHLMDARGSEFQDTSIIPVILEIYSLLCFVPRPTTSHDHQSGTQADLLPPISKTNTKTRPAKVKTTTAPSNNDDINCDDQDEDQDCCDIEQRDDIDEDDSAHFKQPSRLASVDKLLTIKLHNYQLAHRSKTIILAILMGYTQLCLSVSENEEKVISKSMWTKMLKEILEFTMSNPISFMHGLEVLTKIIPAPLPSSSMMDSIDQEQLFRNINHRKLWSAHLHPLHSQIEQMISAFSITHKANLRTLLYYLCNQLCDLSSNAAYMVVKIITDTLVSCAARLSLAESQSSSANNSSAGPSGAQAGPGQTNTSPQVPPNQQQQTSSAAMAAAGATSEIESSTTAANTSASSITAIAAATQAATSSTTATSSTNTSTSTSAQAALAAATTSSSKSQSDLLHQSPLFKNSRILNGSKEVAYVAKMILNLLSNVITNQAFETAFANHLQRLSKKDEKLLANLKDTLKYNDDYRPSEGLVDESCTGQSSGASTIQPQTCVNTVSSFIESIKSMAESGNTLLGGPKDNLDNLTPPDTLCKLNLSEFARKACSDRFPLAANLKHTYRLKVLMDLRSRDKSLGAYSSSSSAAAHHGHQSSSASGRHNSPSATSSTAGAARSFDPQYNYSEHNKRAGSSSSQHQHHHAASSHDIGHHHHAHNHSSHSVHGAGSSSYSGAGSSSSLVGSSRSRLASGRLSQAMGAGGSSSRPDFRSRPQNTSRPPSIHVDDFNDMYGGGASSGADNYRGSSRGSAYPTMAAGPDGYGPGGILPLGPPLGPPIDHHQHYFSPPPANPYGGGGGQRSSSSSSSAYSSSKPKYMKMK